VAIGVEVVGVFRCLFLRALFPTVAGVNVLVLIEVEVLVLIEEGLCGVGHGLDGGVGGQGLSINDGKTGLR